MSPLRALPWFLLAVSLSAHAWNYLRPTPPASASLPRLATAFTPPPPFSPIHPAAPAIIATATTYPTPKLTTPTRANPPAHTATFAGYADILAKSLDTPEQHDDLARVLARWIATDPAAASEWLNNQPYDPRYDLPVSQVANHLTAGGKYALAHDWAMSIRIPEVRSSALEEILAEKYRARLLTLGELRAAAQKDGLPSSSVESILSYSRLD
jgi:hypothetical protein